MIGDGAPGSPQPAPAGVLIGSDETPAKRRRGIKSLLPAPIWQVGRLLFLALVVEYLVVPQLAGPRKVLHLVTEVNPLLLLAGVVLEAGALLSYSKLTQTVLLSSNDVSLFTLFRVEMTTLSVSHCAPGGTAAGTALGYRLLTQAGVKRGDVGFALGTQGIGSALVLNLILWIALIVSIPIYGFSPIYLVAAAVGVVLLGGAAAVFFFFTRGEERVGAALERAADRIPFVDGPALRRTFVSVAGRITELTGDRRLLARAVGWACANWLFDAASLWVFVGAFGHWVNPDGLLVAYGLANVLAAIPITPGGLGVVEATLTSVLVGFGTSRGVATLGVIGYRLIQFWAPIPLGGLTYLSLQVDPGGPKAERHNRMVAAGRRMTAPLAWVRSRGHPAGEGNGSGTLPAD
ncbi:MAG: lysylphosphatidylglycerol synthase transmembrane domain-containing protein [Acidimicrobiales bacterium]